MNLRPDDVSYLVPLFKAAAPYSGDGFTKTLPDPQPGSSLAIDDAPLGTWTAANLIRTSFAAGLTYVHAFDQLVTDTGRLDHVTPWTMLRCALENFSTALWLMTGANQSERRRRALCLWAEDMRNRGQHEDDTQHVPRDGGKTGNERRQDILKLGIDLGLGALANPKAGDIIKSAAKAAGLDATSIQASWRVASGFAHGRYWPNLRAAELQGIALMAGGVLAKVAVDDAELKKLADACRDLLKSAERRYTARCTSRWPS